jgi:hypothetical protein
MTIVSAIEYLDTTDTVQIATELKAGGEVVTLIWSVVVDGVPYIRNAYGPGSKWFMRLLRTNHAVFVDGSARYPVSVQKLDDESVNEQVDAAYRTKYAGQGSPVRSVTSEPVRSATYRVIPE